MSSTLELGCIVAFVVGVTAGYMVLDIWLWKRDLRKDDLDQRLGETHDRFLG